MGVRRLKEKYQALAIDPREAEDPSLHARNCVKRHTVMAQCIEEIHEMLAAINAKVGAQPWWRDWLYRGVVLIMLAAVVANQYGVKLKPDAIKFLLELAL